MGHWYTQEGEAMHWIEGANGKQRDTTLRDAKKHNLYPSVTTILGVIDKPALTGWKLKQVTRACSETDFDIYMDEGYEAYHRAMMEIAFADSTDARDRGSEIHNCLEAFLDPERPAWQEGFAADVADIAGEAAAAIKEYTNGAVLIPEQIVVGDGYAGMVDAHNDEFVIDWKTKDLEPGKKNHWPEMAMQLAAYDMALSSGRRGEFMPPYRRCINVFIDRTTPGNIEIYEWSPEDIELAWKKFCLLRDYWQLEKGYKPGDNND